jgi:hypothetical protein
MTPTRSRSTYGSMARSVVSADGPASARPQDGQTRRLTPSRVAPDPLGGIGTGDDPRLGVRHQPSVPDGDLGIGWAVNPQRLQVARDCFTPARPSGPALVGGRSLMEGRLAQASAGLKPKSRDETWDSGRALAQAACRLRPDRLRRRDGAPGGRPPELGADGGREFIGAAARCVVLRESCRLPSQSSEAALPRCRCGAGREPGTVRSATWEWYGWLRSTGISCRMSRSMSFR